VTERSRSHLFTFQLKNPHSVRQPTENSERLRKHDLVRCFSL